MNSNSQAASDGNNSHQRQVMIWDGADQLEGVLSIPAGARALVVFAYERMGSAEHIPDALNTLADRMRQAGLATLSVNLLTPENEALDTATGFFRENVSVLHHRILGITNWIIDNPTTQSIHIGYFGVGVSAAAALAAAAIRPDAIHAVVAIDPRFDLVSSYLPRLVARTLVISGERNTQALDMSRKAFPQFASDTKLDIVREARERGLANTLEAIPGVANVFENEQSLQKVAQLATWWCTHYLSAS